MASIQPIAMIIIEGVWTVIILATGIYRAWLLRDLVLTPARRASEIFAWTFLLCVFSSVPMEVGMWTMELYAQRAHPEVSDAHILQYIQDSLYQKFEYAVGFIYALHMWLLKAAFLALFYDLKTHLTRRLQYVLYGATAFTGCTLISNLIFVGAYCHPLEKFWKGQCSSILSVPGVVQSSWLNILTDVSLLFLGICVVVDLRKKGARKAVWSLPLLGSVSLIATFVRFVICYRVARQDPKTITLQSVHLIFLFTWVEVLLAWTAFAIPAVRAWRRRRDANLTGNQISSSGHNEQSGRLRGMKKLKEASEIPMKSLQISVRRSYDIDVENVDLETGSQTGSQTELRQMSPENKYLAKFTVAAIANPSR